MAVQPINVHMVLLGNDSLEPDKSALESKTGLLDVSPGQVMKIRDRTYQVLRTRTKTKCQDGIALTMQFIYVEPISAERLMTKIRDRFLV